ncbi:sulfotransferase domain-containing protein [Methylomonas methanica]|nr:sulfotransferase domain-containing protein [Methylomonas methanica]
MNGYYWIASYPKSGNTWIRLMLQSLAGGGRPIRFDRNEKVVPPGMSRTAFDDLLGIESSDLTLREIERLRPWMYAKEAAEATAPMFRKVHDAWVLTSAGDPLFPPELTLGSVYITRDPRDIAVSYAHYDGRSIDRAIDLLADADAVVNSARLDIAGQLPQRLLSWHSHVNSWLDGGSPRILLVRYEDLLADPAEQLRRIVQHCDLPQEPEVLERTLAATRFEVLQEEESRHGFKEKPDSARRFFREGKAGIWRTALSSAQIARIERDHGATMDRLGYH